MIQALLPDIEGTLSSLEFVREVLFPYAREHLGGFIEERRGAPEVAPLLDAARELARAEGRENEPLSLSLQRWIAQDRKLGPLKALQGLLWERAFEQGRFVAHVYPDVAPALRRFREQGFGLYIYSSGSVRAQRAFFRHSAAGDLTPLLDGYFDTAVGSKSSPASYLTIAGQLRLDPGALLFLSDSIAELDAAREAGLGTLALRREPFVPGLHEPSPSASSAPHAAATQLGELELEAPPRAVPPGSARRHKAEVVTLARHCHARGWAEATSGNFSVRAGSDRMAITASGVDKEELGEHDVLFVGLDLRPLEPGTPSAEAPLHAALYRGDARIGAVLHTHSVASTVLSRRAAASGALHLVGYEMAKALAPAAGGVPPELTLPIFANDQDSVALAGRISEHLARSPAAAYLVEGHGLTTWGPDAQRARRHADALEFLLRCELEAARLSGPLA